MRAMSAIRCCMAVLVLAIIAGCGGGSSGKGGGAPSSENRDDLYREYARRYGELLFKGDFKSAYELCSPHIRDKMTLEQFTAKHLEEMKTYGKPVKLDASINFTRPELLKDSKGFNGAPPEIRQARVFVYFYINEDERYCLGLDVVNDNGTDRVASFDYSIH